MHLCIFWTIRDLLSLLVNEWQERILNVIVPSFICQWESHSLVYKGIFCLTESDSVGTSWWAHLPVLQRSDIGKHRVSLSQEDAKTVVYLKLTIRTNKYSIQKKDGRDGFTVNMFMEQHTCKLQAILISLICLCALVGPSLLGDSQRKHEWYLLEFLILEKISSPLWLYKTWP